MKSLQNIVEDIYANINPLCEGDSIDLTEEQIDKFGDDMKEVLRDGLTLRGGIHLSF